MCLINLNTFYLLFFLFFPGKQFLSSIFSFFKHMSFFNYNVLPLCHEYFIFSQAMYYMEIRQEKRHNIPLKKSPLKKCQICQILQKKMCQICQILAKNMSDMSDIWCQISEKNVSDKFRYIVQNLTVTLCLCSYIYLL